MSDKIRWGTFEAEDSVHVIPCDIEGCPLRPHIIDKDCPCRPIIEVFAHDKKSRPILSHNMIQ